MVVGAWFGLSGRYLFAARRGCRFDDEKKEGQAARC